MYEVREVSAGVFEATVTFSDGSVEVAGFNTREQAVENSQRLLDAWSRPSRYRY